MSDNPIPCACGGFWPDDHVQDCTHKEMAKLWPKSYRNELERRQTGCESRCTCDHNRSGRHADWCPKASTAQFLAGVD